MAASNNLIGPGVNAKTIAFDQPGAGVIGYGINANNLYPKLTKLYGARMDKAGGSKGIWDAMVNNTNKSLARSKSPIALEFQNFLNTGKMPANPSPQFQKYASESLDYGLREVGRAQQHKPVSFLSKLVDPLAEIALGFVPGIGPALAAAYGGIKGGVENGFLGGLTGALGGYGAGSLGGSLGNAVSSTGGWASALSNPGAFGHNLVGELNPFTVKSAGALGGYGGTASSAAGSILPHIGGAGAKAGGTMGAFSDLLSPVTDFVGNFNYGTGGNLLTDAAKLGLNYYGSQSAQNQMNSAANRAFNNAQFTPYAINTPGGSASFVGNSATGALSPAAKKVLDQYQANMNTGATAFSKFNPNNYAQNMYTSLSNLRAPDVTRANNDLLSNTYNLGQWGSTTGADKIYSQDMANNLQDQALRLQSQSAGANESDRLFNQYMKSAAAYHDLLNSPSKLIDQGLSAGGQRSAANSSANQYPWLAAQNSADASAAFWSSLGNSMSNWVTNSTNRDLSTRSSYQPIYDPGTGYMYDLPRGP
jgi:hypothetical protein